MTLLSLKLYSQTTHHNKVPHDWFVDLSILFSLFENGVCPSKMGGLHGQAPIGAAIAKQKLFLSFCIFSTDHVHHLHHYHHHLAAKESVAGREAELRQWWIGR